MFSGNYHVILVHFPIVFLLLYPALIIASLSIKKYRKELLFASFVSLVLGTIGSGIASETGEALEDWVQHIAPQIYDVFQRHESYAEATTLLGWCLVALHILTFSLHRYKKMALGWMKWIFLVGGLGAGLLVSLAASEGGKLTHFYHVGAIHCQETAHPIGELSAGLLQAEADAQALNGLYLIDESASARDLFESICEGKLKIYQ